MSFVTLEKGQEARKLLLKGAKKLHDAVSASMGPSGRNMYFESRENAYLSKDGATIAKWIYQSRLIDPFERAGAAMMRRASMKAEEEAGDGTTAATVLCYAMMTAAIDAVDKGENVMGIERGMRLAHDAIVKELQNLNKPADTRDLWEKVAFISSRDKEVAKTIGEAMERVGSDGYIRVEAGDDWREHDLTLEIKEGMTFPRGFATETAINDRTKLQCILRDVPILVTDLELFTERDAIALAGIAQACYAEGYKKLVIIGKKFNGRVTDFILQNNIPYHQKGGERGDGMIILPIEAPGFGTSFTDEFCDDIAVLTGATFISNSRGNGLHSVPLNSDIMDFLGKCEIIEAKQKETNIVNSHADPESISQRVAEIRSKYDKAEGELDKSRFKQRLAALTAGMAVITVGGRHVENIQEKKARVDDAVLATKCANEEGIVPGAGMALIRCMNAISSLKGADKSEDVGISIVRESLTAPLIQIAKNCCIDPSTVCETAADLKPSQTINMQRGEIEIVDAFDSGVVDPLKVVKSALLNAIEGALTFITTETVGVTLPEDKDGRPIWEVTRGDAAAARKE